MDPLEIPLTHLQSIPDSITEIAPTDVKSVFPTPTLMSLKGRRKNPLFLSLMLHGNETTSFYVLQKLATQLRQQELPRSLIIFVGNVEATAQGQRYLEGQEDYNRVWLPGNSPEHNLAKRVRTYALSDEPLFASIDIHNNTGSNPLYACIHRLKDEHVYLGSLFAKTLVYFENPNAAQSVVFAENCPAVTLECSQPGTQPGIDRAFQYVWDVLHLESLNHDQKKLDVSIFQTKGRLHLKSFVDYDFSFGEGEDTLIFPDNLETLNFSMLIEGTELATYDGEVPPFRVESETKADIFHDYFAVVDKKILIKKPLIPSMFTKDKNVIRQDCLGYIMEQIR